MTPAEHVISKLGGLTETSRLTGHPITTVQGWKVRGTIPQRHWSSLIEASSNSGERLVIEDFVSPIAGAAE